MRYRSAITIMAFLLSLACSQGRNPAPATGSWDGNVQVHGALHAMLHEGQTGPNVSLDSLLPDPDLYALGALAELSGEVTIVRGKVYLSYPAGDTTRTETPARTNAAATLFVSSRVGSWRSVSTKRLIAFEDLDEEIAKLATEAGISRDDRFPFLLEGDFEDLEWHVVDGRRMTAGGTSHQDHKSAAVNARRDRASATLVGFYSQSDQGVFTHTGSRTHVHCVLDDPLVTGHVDHVVIPAGTTLRFPVVGSFGYR